MTTKKVYFVRHGETDANLKRYLGGRDEELNETGEYQATIVADRLKSINPNVVLESDWKRARQTAKIINDRLNIAIRTVPELGEFNFPKNFTNMSYQDEEIVNYSKTWQENLHDPEHKFDGSESFNDLLQRASQLKELLEATEESVIVAVTHSRFLRFFTSFILVGELFTPEIDYQMNRIFKPTNTGITLFELTDQSWQLKTFNDIAHFAE